MKRIFTPMLFLMANTPEAERNMELLSSLLQTTVDAVKNIKGGFDSFNATIIKVAENMPGPIFNQDKPAGQAGPAAKTGAPAADFDPAPSIQMPSEKV